MKQTPSERSPLIVLGASNVANCTPEIAAVGQAVFGPIDLFLAAGHGRSYLHKSSLMGRTLPGIGDCQIWDYIPAAAENAVAIITDIGNDILYGVPIETIGMAVKQCIIRLLETTPNIAITGLPVESVASLGKYRYLLMRSILFPSARFSLSEATERVHQLEEQIDGLVREFEIAKLQPERAWFGIDPIHIRRRYRIAAWTNYLGEIGATRHAQSQIRNARSCRSKMRFLRHETKWLFGNQTNSRQPTRELTDGSRVFLF